MKKTRVPDKTVPAADDLRPEYEFDYQNARPNRFANRIAPEGRIVTLDADVSQVFTTSEAVNAVLRALIAAMPAVHAGPR